jgi:hypothetical protein
MLKNAIESANYCSDSRSRRNEFDVIQVCHVDYLVSTGAMSKMFAPYTAYTAD